MSDWYQPLRNIASLGSQVKRPGSLVGLHAARREHLGQFFTSDALAGFLWKLATPAMQRAQAEEPGCRLSLLDNSVGTGRMFQYADPKRHTLAGTDVHKPSVQALAKAAKEAGFVCEFENTGMQTINPKGFHIGLINPPFSIHLESPFLEPYPCTTWGKFGPNTSAMSQAYALHQALDACQLVFAIVPRTYANEILKDSELPERLAAVYHIAGTAFSEENTEVRVSVLAFDWCQTPTRTPQTFDIKDLAAPVKDFGLSLRLSSYDRARLSPRLLEDTEPVVTLPVTGDRTVRVTHDGRRIGLRFACGHIQAEVMNTVYMDRVPQPSQGAPRHRYPKGVEYCGQGLLDVEILLSTPDPMASFGSLLDRIRSAQGEPSVDPGLMHYIKRRIRQSQREKEPLRHEVYRQGAAAAGNTIKVRAKQTLLLKPDVWGSPVLSAGKTATLTRNAAGQFELADSGVTYIYSADEVEKSFTMISKPVASGWTVIHPGLLEVFPEQAQALRKRAEALGIPRWLTWGYQLDDLVELALKPKGAVCGWKPGLGKARLAWALALLAGGRHNLIVVEAGLIDEMRRELKGLPIAPNAWQVITTPAQTRALKPINLITYERLRAPVCRAHQRRTFARLLRRRIATLIADEGDVLHNRNSDQSRALWMLSPRRRYLLTGTPIANYPRDLLPLFAYTNGDGTAAMPYGYYRPYIEAKLSTSMAFCSRGVDEFRERFVTLEWCTNEFREDLQGAKREVPKIQKLPEYREMLAAHLKRRVSHEPDCAKHIHIPIPTYKTSTLDWDPAHLRFYLKVADEFSSWYAEQRRRSGETGTRVNLVALLARIGAVSMACNYPQHGIDGFGYYIQLTSKQRYVVDRLEELTRQGHKTILYANNPGCAERIARELDKRDIEAVLFHGNLTPSKRMRALDNRFRFGPAPVLAASLGVTQKGLNIPQADRIIMLNRSWTAKVEEQAIDRVLRPQQKRDVEIEFVHLAGGIDEYQAQMVAHKADSAAAGLDYLEPEYTDVDFLHLDTILGRFCEQLAELHGCNRMDLKERLAEVA